MNSMAAERRDSASGPDRGRGVRTANLTRHGLVAPPLIFYVLLSIFPLVLTVYFSFTNVNAAGVGSWVGIGNYQKAVSDPILQRGYANTLLFAVVGVPLQYVLGLSLALLVNGATRGVHLMRFAFVAPFAITPLVAGFVWSTLLDTRFGPVNDVITALGGSAIPWLTDPFFAFVSVLIVDTWMWTPFVFLLMYTGLRMLPSEPFEAARVDGASGWRVFRDVTFPMLMPFTLGVLLLRSIEAMKLFDIVYYMTAGGPGNSTSTVSLLAYFAGPKSNDYGYAATMSVLLLITAIAFGMSMPGLVAAAMRRRGDGSLARAQEAVASGRFRAEREAEMAEL